MLNQRYAEASVEVLDILEHMDPNHLVKVSNKFIDFLKENASREYMCNLDYSKKLNEMNLKEETRGLLALMYENYWCPEEEKQDLQKKFYENEQKYQEELRQKYNPDNIFSKKNKNIIEIEDNQTQLIEYKETIFRRILNKIKALFNIK